MSDEDVRKAAIDDAVTVAAQHINNGGVCAWMCGGTWELPHADACPGHALLKAIRALSPTADDYAEHLGPFGRALVASATPPREAPASDVCPECRGDGVTGRCSMASRCPAASCSSRTLCSVRRAAVPASALQGRCERILAPNPTSNQNGADE